MVTRRQAASLTYAKERELAKLLQAKQMELNNLIAHEREEVRQRQLEREANGTAAIGAGLLDTNTPLSPRHAYTSPHRPASASASSFIPPASAAQSYQQPFQPHPSPSPVQSQHFSPQRSAHLAGSPTYPDYAPQVSLGHRSQQHPQQSPQHLPPSHSAAPSSYGHTPAFGHSMGVGTASQHPAGYTLGHYPSDAQLDSDSRASRLAITEREVADIDTWRNEIEVEERLRASRREERELAELKQRKLDMERRRALEQEHDQQLRASLAISRAAGIAAVHGNKSTNNQTLPSQSLSASVSASASQPPADHSSQFSRPTLAQSGLDTAPYQPESWSATTNRLNASQNVAASSSSSNNSPHIRSTMPNTTTPSFTNQSSSHSAVQQPISTELPPTNVNDHSFASSQHRLDDFRDEPTSRVSVSHSGFGPVASNPPTHRTFDQQPPMTSRELEHEQDENEGSQTSRLMQQERDQRQQQERQYQQQQIERQRQAAEEQARQQQLEREQQERLRQQEEEEEQEERERRQAEEDARLASAEKERARLEAEAARARELQAEAMRQELAREEESRRVKAIEEEAARKAEADRLAAATARAAAQRPASPPSSDDAEDEPPARSGPFSTLFGGFSGFIGGKKKPPPKKATTTTTASSSSAAGNRPSTAPTNVTKTKPPAAKKPVAADSDDDISEEDDTELRQPVVPTLSSTMLVKKPLSARSKKPIWQLEEDDIEGDFDPPVSARPTTAPPKAMPEEDEFDF